MDIGNWISLAAFCLPVLVAGLVWLVRLEGKIKQVETATSTYGDTKMEVVRLQEQIKHLTNLLERYFIPGGSSDGHSNTR